MAAAITTTRYLNKSWGIWWGFIVSGLALQKSLLVNLTLDSIRPNEDGVHEKLRWTGNWRLSIDSN